jgi:hypothetical protein
VTGRARGDAIPVAPPARGDESSVAERARWVAFDRLLAGRPVPVPTVAETLGIDTEAARAQFAGRRRPARRGWRWHRRRFTDLDQLEAGRADVEAAIRAWCDWKA